MSSPSNIGQTLPEARLLELATVLIGCRQAAELLEVALAELAELYPGSSWVIFRRLSKGRYEGRSLVGVSRRDVTTLIDRALPAAPTVDLDTVVSTIMPFDESPIWCGWPARALQPDWVLAAWGDPMAEKPSIPEVATAIQLIANAHASATELGTLRAQSATDALTNLLSRRAILERLTCERRRARRYKHPVSVLYLDVDRFKRINDTHGHEVGDHALASLGTTLRYAVRDCDAVGRVGGDEFLVVLPHTGSRQAAAVARSIQEAVSAIRIPIGEGAISIGITVGVASTDEDGGADIVNLADMRMLERKKHHPSTRTGRRFRALVNVG